MRTNRHFDHNIGNEGNRTLNRVERARMLGRKGLIAIELHAKANLVQAAIAQLCQTRIVKKIAARIQAHVRLRVQLARRIEKRVHIAFEQQRFAAGNRQAIETGTRGVRLTQLARNVALMRKPILVVFLVGIEAEIAMPRALERSEERRRSLACAACNARRRNPVPPQARIPVFAMAAALLRHAHARLTKLRLLRLKRQTEFRNRFLEIGFHLVKCGNVLLRIHSVSPPARPKQPTRLRNRRRTRQTRAAIRPSGRTRPIRLCDRVPR